MKLKAHDQECRRALEVHVQMLTEKLTERLHLFVEVKSPGGARNKETAVWEALMHRGADNLKFENSMQQGHLGLHLFILNTWFCSMKKNKKMLRTTQVDLKLWLSRSHGF
jgi:hypothetical protein